MSPAPATTRTLPWIFIIAACVACSSTPPVREAVPEPQDPYGPARYGPECTEAIARARNDPTGQTIPGFQQPLARAFALPPTDLPPAVRGATIVYTALVDSTGAPDVDRSTLAGVRDRRYARRFQDTLNRVRYWPARLNGCAVPGIYTISFTLR